MGKKKEYSCATTEDLWRHCTNSSGQDVPAVMDNWIKTTGYPYVNAILSPSSEGGCTSASSSISVSLTQERFLANGAKTEDNVTWFCPVKIIVGVEEKHNTHTI